MALRSLSLRGLPYFIVAVCVTLAGVAKYLLLHDLGIEIAFLLTACLIFLSAWWGGLGPGLFATILAALLLQSFWLPILPFGGSFGQKHVAQIAAFLLAGGALSASVTRYRHKLVLSQQQQTAERDRLTVQATAALAAAATASEALRVANAELEARIAARTEELEQANRRLEAELAERTQIEAALRASEARFRAVVSSLSDGIVLQDAAGNNILCNGSAAQLLAISQDELLSRTPDDVRWHIVHGDGTPLTSDEHVSMAALRTGQPQRGLVAGVTYADGSLRWFEVNAEPITLDDSEHPTVVVTSFRDITARKATEQALREREAMLRSFYDSAPMMMGVVEVVGNDTMHLSDNAASARFFGIPVEQLRNQRASVMGVPQEHIDFWIRHYEASARANNPVQFEYVHHTPTGDRLLRATVSPITLSAAVPTRFCYIVDDITQQREAEKTFFESQERFRRAFEDAAIGMALVSLDGRWLQVNGALCDITGYGEAELLTMQVRQITHPDDVAANDGCWAQLISGDLRTYQIEQRYINRVGQHVWVLLNVSLVRDSGGQPRYGILQIQDISARMQAEEQVRASLAEKEVLLKEIHHRVKNNLQVIVSLLRLQSDYSDDQRVRELFVESQRRVRSMALVHERLYQSHDLAHIDFGEYARSLVQDLVRSYRGAGPVVAVRVEIKAVALDIDRSIQLGLILNELVSNSLKHAFPDGRRGELWVSLEQLPNGHLVFVVGDNGVGLPLGLDLTTTESMGLQVVSALSAQLGGTLTTTGECGTVVTLEIPERMKAHV